MVLIKCETCGRGPATGHTVYRANEKGQPGRWRCEYHRRGIPVDEDVLAVVRALSKPNRK